MSDHKSLFKHSRNYFFATIATRALAFVSIPVYTRLLTVEEYGVVGVFMSLIGIISVLLTLDSDVAISRYYYDAKDEEDFKEFVGTNIRLSSIIFALTSFIFIALLPFLAKAMSFPKLLVVCFIPVSLYEILHRMFESIYQPLLQSKKIAIVSSAKAYLAFGISAVFMLLMKDEKYYGYVFGNIAAMLVMGSYMVGQIKKYYKRAYKKEHIKYIFNYCLPYIPYTLSGVLLSQFSRIFIGNNQGFALAGSYTLTTNIAALMLIVIGITHNAWNPYYFQYMTDRDYKSVNNDYNLIWRCTIVGAFFIAAFGYELALILSKGDDYLETLRVLPPLVVGFILYQWAYVYLRNTGFAKRNIWNAYCVIGSGVANVLLNAILVPYYQETGAAIATFSSYLVLLVLSYLTNRFVIKEYVPRLWFFVKTVLFSLPFFFIISIVYWIDLGFITSLIIKIVLCLVVSIVMLLPYKEQAMSFASQIIGKNGKKHDE